MSGQRLGYNADRGFSEEMLNLFVEIGHLCINSTLFRDDIFSAGTFMLVYY